MPQLSASVLSTTVQQNQISVHVHPFLCFMPQKGTRFNVCIVHPLPGLDIPRSAWSHICSSGFTDQLSGSSLLNPELFILVTASLFVCLETHLWIRKSRIFTKKPITEPDFGCRVDTSFKLQG